MLIYLNNGQPGADGFGRATLLNLNNSLPLFSLVSSNSSFWAGGSQAFVTTYAELKAATLNTSITTIILGKDIIFNGSDPSLTIDRRCSVNFNGYKFIKTGTTKLVFEGEINAPRVQIFSGWSAGTIKGTPRNDALFPEWWGLQGSGEEDGRHDIAINCAIRMADHPNNGEGRTISFAAGSYYVGRPIDATELGIRFKGAGSGSTKIFASKLWTSDTWEPTTRFRFWDSYMRYSGTTNFTAACSVPGGTRLVTPVGGAFEFLSGAKARVTNSSIYNGVYTVSATTAAASLTSVVLSGLTFVSNNATGFITPITLDSEMETASCASSLFWIGGGNLNYWSSVPEMSGVYNNSGGARYWSGIEGMTIIAKWATILNPTKRISVISWKHNIEELTIIRDVDIQHFSGMGIGGGMYDNWNNDGTYWLQNGGIINGLQVQNFWIKEATRRGAIPIFINKNASVCSIKTGTIDCTTEYSITLSSVGYPYSRTWPLFGILIYQGDGVSVENVHLEGMGIGVHIGATGDGGSMVTLASIESERLMSFGMNDTDQFQPANARYVPLSSGVVPLSVQMRDQSFGYFNYLSSLALSGFLPDPGSYLFRYSALVTIGTSFEKAAWDSKYPNNVFSTVNITNIGGPNHYILRDLHYGIDIPGYGDGSTPNEFNRRVSRYTRTNAYGPASGAFPNLTAGRVFNDYPARNPNITWFAGVQPTSSWDKTYYQLIL